MPGSKYTGQYDGLSLGSGGIALTYAGFTVGGNAILDQNVNLHSDWDDIPFDLGDAWTRELMTAARGVPKSEIDGIAVTVKDNKGRYVGGLTKDAFTVIEDPRVTKSGVTTQDLIEQLNHNLRVLALVSDVNRAVASAKDRVQLGVPI